MRRLLIILSSIALVSCAPKTTNTKALLVDSSIINGRDVKSGESLGSSVVAVYNTKNKYLCTGTLIDTNVVLTAAHCAPERISQLKIVFTIDIDETVNAREPDILEEFALQVTDFKTSPKWDVNDETTEVDTGDIALVKFRGTIPKGWAPVKRLTDSSEIKIGAVATVAGFGVDFVDTSKRVDPKKYYNIQEAIDNGDIMCEESGNNKKEKYTNCFKIEMSGDGLLRTANAPISFLTETEIHLNEKKAGTCSGDSGGPVFLTVKGELLLLGVTSRGSELCDEVGVYTNAVYYKQWIDDTMKILK